MRSNDNISKRRAITKQSPSKGYGGEFDALVDAFDGWFEMLEGVFNILEGLPDMLEGLFNMLEGLFNMLEDLPVMLEGDVWSPPRYRANNKTCIGVYT